MGRKIVFVATDITSVHDKGQIELTPEEYLRQRLRLPFA
jgi:hypothetical protein